MPGGTPYLTPAMLLDKPASISWLAVPTLTADSADQLAQIWDACWKATSIADTYCRQPLRATVNTETGNGPGRPRMSVDRANHRGVLVTRRWPVTEVNAIAVSQARSFPPQWSLVPASQYRIRHPVTGNAGPAPETGPSGGNVIDVAPGYITWDYGRAGLDALLSYTSGWPHTSLTDSAEEGATTLTVDDVTGWAGWTGFAYDGPSTEAVQVTSVSASEPPVLEGPGGTVQAGPGTLTLSSPLATGHATGTVISALPGSALHAVVLAATVQALEGIDAIATQSLSGQMAGGTGALAEQYELLLDDFRRIA